MGDDIPGAVVKIIELVGSSEESFSDAVRNAVKTASRTIRDIRGVDVINSTAEVGPDGELSLYKVHCKVAFVIRDEIRADGDGGQRATAGAGARTRPPSDS